MQKWNRPTERVQRIDKENWIICLFMFTHRGIAIKMSKMALFSYFLLNTTKNQS